MARRTETVEETPWWLDVNGVRTAVGTTTPERIEALVAGRLLVDGYIARPTDLLSLSVVYEPPGCVGVRVQVPVDRANAARAEREHRTAHGCGVRHLIDCGASVITRARTTLPTTIDFPNLFRDLFSAAERYQHTGGIHIAALSDGEELFEAVEDVGRHNAVDKVIGGAFLEHAELGNVGLLLSARVSAEIAWKAARAGVGWVASRSIATDLAVEIAGVAGLPIVARAAGKEARVFGGGSDTRESAGPMQGLPELGA